MSKIKTFLNSITNTINKSDAEVDLEQSLNRMKTTIEAYAIAFKVVPEGKLSSAENIKASKDFYLDSSRVFPDGVNMSFNKNIFQDVRTLLINVLENGEKVLAPNLKAIKSNVVSTTSIGATEANLLRAVPHYYFISRFSDELLNFLMANEIQKANGGDTGFAPVEVKRIQDHMLIYAQLLSSYAVPTATFRKTLEMIPNEVLTKGQNDRVDEYQYDHSLELVPYAPNGFLGSPIYSIRLAIANWQADNYHEAVDTRDLLLLRLNYYESLANGGQPDEEVEKEIKYLQGKVSKLNRKIAKVEESVK